jgi:hypothetical protein
MPSALLPFAGKDEDGLTIRGVCAVSTDVENVVELGFLQYLFQFALLHHVAGAH